MSSDAVSLPHRPALPFAFFAALGAWSAAYGAEAASWHCWVSGISSTWLMVAAIGMGAAVFLMLLMRRRLAPSIRFLETLLFVALSSCIIFACSALHWSCWESSLETLDDSEEQTFEVELEGDPSAKDYGVVSKARTTIDGRSMDLRLIWPDEVEPSLTGRMIQVQGKVLLPQDDDAGRWNHRNGLSGSIDASAIEDLGEAVSLRGLLSGFRNSSFDRIATPDGDCASILAGILLGNKTLFEGTELEHAFRTTGLAHLMAVSGTHLAIVTMLLSALLAATPLRRKHRSAILVIALACYVALTGFAPSAIRACIMCGVALAVGSFKRRSNHLNALSLCVYAFICLEPSIIFSIGFELSVLAVFGLVLFGEIVTCWIAALAPRLPRAASSSLSATLTASFLTLPVTAPLFAQLPLISPLSNLLTAPLITAALSLGMIGMVLCPVVFPLGMLMLHASGFVANVCATVVRFLAGIPGGCLPLSSNGGIISACFIVLVVAIWILWPLPEPSRRPRPSLRVARVAIALLILFLPLTVTAFTGFGRFLLMKDPGDSRIVMLDVGQGDSMLIQSGGASVLVDTGEKADVLVRELAEQGTSRLDAIVLTHKDADHTGALGGIAGIIGVDHVYVHEDLLEESCERNVIDAASLVLGEASIEGVSPGSTLRIGDFTLRVLAPVEGGESDNADSLITLLEYDADHDGSVETRGLLTGDAESDAIQAVVAGVGDIDFIKVAHHGSKKGIEDEQLSVLKPEIALFSVGAGNRYGHPNPSTVMQYEQIGAALYRTDRQGAITISFDMRGYEVRTEKRAESTPGSPSR